MIGCASAGGVSVARALVPHLLREAGLWIAQDGERDSNPLSLSRNAEGGLPYLVGSRTQSTLSSTSHGDRRCPVLGVSTFANTVLS